MAGCYKLSWKPGGPQTPADASFIGGHPRMPKDTALPSCRLCGQTMTFFLQVQFPLGGPWEGRTLCVFACTSCIRREYLVPQRPENYNIESFIMPDNYLDRHEINFKSLVFEPGAELVVREDYPEKIVFQRITLTKLKRTDTLRNKIGGVPTWRDNEMPVAYMGSPFVFLMQLLGEIKFPTLPSAPPQPHPSGIDNRGFYELFVGLPTYFMGTETHAGPKVYTITHR